MSANSEVNADARSFSRWYCTSKPDDQALVPLIQCLGRGGFVTVAVYEMEMVSPGEFFERREIQGGG
jgi:hypothetical protein